MPLAANANVLPGSTVCVSKRAQRSKAGAVFSALVCLGKRMSWPEMRKAIGKIDWLKLQTMVESICLGMRLRPMQGDKSKRQTASCVPVCVCAYNCHSEHCHRQSVWRNRLIIDAEEKEASAMNMGENERKWAEMHKIVLVFVSVFWYWYWQFCHLPLFRPRLSCAHFFGRHFSWWCLLVAVHPLAHSLTLTL